MGAVVRRQLGELRRGALRREALAAVEGRADVGEAEADAVGHGLRGVSGEPELRAASDGEREDHELGLRRVLDLVDVDAVVARLAAPPQERRRHGARAVRVVPEAPPS